MSGEMLDESGGAGAGAGAGTGAGNETGAERGAESGTGAGAGVGNETGAERGAGTEAREKPAAGDAQAGEGESPKASSDKESQERDPELAPVKQWSEVKLDLPKDANIDPELLASFGKFVEQNGLNARQAKGLVAFQLKAVQDFQKAQIEAGQAVLEKEWGARAGANREQILGLISRVDRSLGNEEFSKALGQCGACNSATILKGLLVMAKMTAEDSGGRVNGSDAVGQESALEGLKDAFKKARGR